VGVFLRVFAGIFDFLTLDIWFLFWRIVKEIKENLFSCPG